MDREYLHAVGPVAQVLSTLVEHLLGLSCLLPLLAAPLRGLLVEGGRGVGGLALDHEIRRLRVLVVGLGPLARGSLDQGRGGSCVESLLLVYLVRVLADVFQELLSRDLFFLPS